MPAVEPQSREPDRFPFRLLLLATFEPSLVILSFYLYYNPPHGHLFSKTPLFFGGFCNRYVTKLSTELSTGAPHAVGRVALVALGD
jgi:hypothetical protein